MKSLVLALSLFLLVTAVSPADAQQIRIASANANLRQGPNTSQQIVGTLPAGTVLQVIERAETWYHVQLAADLGLHVPSAYIHESLVEPVAGHVGQARPAPQQRPYPQPQQGYPASPTGYPVNPAQYGGAMPAGYKDPGTARLLSVVITGGGQFYSGETMKGVTILGVGLGSIIAGSMLTAMNANDCVYDYYNGSTDGCTASMVWPSYVGWGVALGAWVYGIMDADDSAARANARLGFAAGQTGVAPMLSVGRSGEAVVGLNVTF